MGQEEPKGRRAFRKILEDRNEKMRRLLMKMEAEDAKREAKDAAREQRAIREAARVALEFQEAMRWASVYNRPLAYRYRHTKKKRTRKKYAKRILTWYREEVL